MLSLLGFGMIATFLSFQVGLWDNYYHDNYSHFNERCFPLDSYYKKRKPTTIRQSAHTCRILI